MRPARPHLALLGLALVVVLGGCPGDEPDACSPELEKRAITDLVYDWYLFPELLPPAAERVTAPSRFATSADLLAGLTAQAREQRMDRGWSYVTTATAARTFFEEGKSVGLGVGLLVRGERVFVSQVYGGSAADEAGFARGDELLRIGETAETLVLVTPENVGSLLGESAAGVTRHVEVRPANATEPAPLREVTKRLFDLDPVPLTDSGERWKIFPPRADGTRAGYVALRTFIGPADAQLEAAFAAFAREGVTDVVVDLRYNGGGLVRTGELLANLLGGGRAANEVMYRSTNNARHAASDGTRFFAPLASSIAPRRVAFVTTSGSASASELVPNVVEPYQQGERGVAMVGARTYGKPVGQRGFEVRGCETLVYLVSFKLENAQGDGEFFDGLPDAGGAFGGPLCQAADDLEHPQWDEAEASTSAALHWLATGECPAAPPPAIAKPALRLAADDAPAEAPRPSLAQRHVSGLF